MSFIVVFGFPLLLKEECFNTGDRLQEQNNSFNRIRILLLILINILQINNIINFKIYNDLKNLLITNCNSHHKIFFTIYDFLHMFSYAGLRTYTYVKKIHF